MACFSSVSNYSLLTIPPKQSLTPLYYRNRRSVCGRVRAEAMATEKLGIKIEKNPPDSKLSDLGIRNWPKWGCPPSKFPWTYSAKETCYLLEGKVKVYPEGADDFVEIGAGDLVVFPKGMSCTWDVSVAVDKHYKFE
uniref:(S)-ureidoglycine aminohydrolase cupin domain-containing protein n=1 Tax=Kalanchoe fedtschenkoi TaxID=63787 RepID=A0A7N0TSV8_KALFE